MQETRFTYKGHKVEIDRDFNKFHCNQISIDGRIVARPLICKDLDHSEYAKALIDYVEEANGPKLLDCFGQPFTTQAESATAQPWPFDPRPMPPGC
jgi:hypothetical protein